MIKSDFIKKEAINAGVFNFILNGVFVFILNPAYKSITQTAASFDTLITVFIITVIVSGFSYLGVKKIPSFNEMTVIFIMAVLYSVFGFVLVGYLLPDSIFPISFKYFIVLKMLWTAILGSSISYYANTYLLKGSEL